MLSPILYNDNTQTNHTALVHRPPFSVNHTGILYNDNTQTNHTALVHCPPFSFTHTGTPGKKVYAEMVLTYDPYIQSMWVTSTCGQLLFDAQVVTAETYCRIWEEKVGKK
jgi:hypothetical protein